MVRCDGPVTLSQLMIQFAGIKEQGPISYVKHIVPGGVPLLLWPMLFLIGVRHFPLWRRMRKHAAAAAD